ncbi:MAG TPA: hypothetical protein VNO33_12360 [Kofleriaceae bacterium]|nr:hypothetical protein [Kofleriaceae bacterium]
MAGGSPDDKRVGDATLQRIDDLAGGWSVPKRARREDEPTERPGAPAGEAPKATGSAAGEKARASKKKPRDKTRAKGKERGKTSAARRTLGDPSAPPLPRAPRGTEQPPEGPGRQAIEDDDDDDDRAATEISDRARTRAMSDRIATEVSDRAATRLIADRAETEISTDHAATLIYGERGSTELDHPSLEDAPPGDGPPANNRDETMLEPPGSGAYAVARADAARKAGSTTAVLRLPPTLPRRRGVLGDLLYVWTAFFGVARANREIAAVDRKLETEKASRGRRLADLARLALADSELENETVARGREEIIELEDQRSRRAGAAAAAEADIAGLERDREDEKKAHAQELESLRREGAAIDEQLDPLLRRVQGARRRAFRLQDTLSDLDRRLLRMEKRLARMKPEQAAAAEAHLASLRAERQAMADEQPAIAAELDELDPAIANLVASRADGRKRAVRVEKAERDAIARVAEKVTAVRARRVVEERAEAELAEAQDEALGALGERLGEERPAELGSRLRGIEEHEVAIATLERRHLELTELVRALDRWAVARGVLWMLAIAVAVAAAMVWSFALRTS